MALSRGEAIYDGLTLRLLHKRGWIRRDGVATAAGHQAANAAAHDEALWALYRRLNPGSAALAQYHRILPVRAALPQDMVQELEDRFTREGGVVQSHKA